MKILTTLFAVLIISLAAFAQNAINSNPCKTQNNHNHTDSESKETCLVIAKDYFLVLNQYKEERGDVFSNPRIRHKDKTHKLQLDINTTKIEQFDFIMVSPNKKYMAMHYVLNDGYVYLSETDSVYHEVFKSSIISMKTGKVLVEELSPLESQGSWNKKNKWVDSSGTTLIDPKKL